MTFSPPMTGRLREIFRSRVLAFAIMSAGLALVGCGRPVGFEQNGNWIWLPKNYTGKERWGLFVYISSQNDHQGVPTSWQSVFNAHHLLYVCPQKAGNEAVNSARSNLAISAVFKINQHYAIDLKRVYVAGLSGGARIACDLGLQRPDIFGGVIAMSGADFYRQVPRVTVTQTDLTAHPGHYGVFDIDSKEALRAKQTVRFVFTTGGNDFREHFIEDVVNGGYRAEGFQVELFDDPKAGHGYTSGSTLKKALQFLEGTTSP